MASGLAMSTETPTDDLDRIRRERDLYRRLLELGSRDALEPFIKEALELVEQTAVELGWEEIRVDPARGTLEAQDVTRIFMFVDDVVVRVRPQGRGSVLDIRSKSRDGRGDMGANAARIRSFLEKVPR